MLYLKRTCVLRLIGICICCCYIQPLGKLSWAGNSVLFDDLQQFPAYFGCSCLFFEGAVSILLWEIAKESSFESKPICFFLPCLTLSCSSMPCTAPCCTSLSCTVLLYFARSVVLCCVVLCCVVLCRVMLCCVVLCSVLLCCVVFWQY